MKKLFATLIAVLGMALCASAEETPIITLTTSAYNSVGAENSFTIVIGGKAGQYIDVDCGFGLVEHELEETVFDATTGTLTGTYITCKVSQEGVVRIYGDAAGIDYFNASGCYLRTVDFATLTDLRILSLEHNELEGLDLTPFSKLEAVYIADNPYSASTPLKIGGNKPNLAILQMGTSDWLDQSFNLSDYPAMASFDAYGAHDLRKLDPTGCPELLQLSIDATQVSSLDVSKNTKLMILNISDCPITSIDLSNNPELTQLYADHGAAAYSQYKIKNIDVSHCPKLYYLFLGYNDIAEIDLSNNPELFDFSIPNNKLTTIDLSRNPKLYNVNIRKNRLSFATLPFDPGTWSTYYYEQMPLQVNRSYKVGDIIDLSDKVLRAGTETIATLYHYNENSPIDPILADADSYSYANGKITLLKEMSDSLFVRFENSSFEEYPLSTTNFMVKSAANYGQPNTMITMLPAIDSGVEMTFSLGLASEDGSAPTFYLDAGNGKKQQMTIEEGTNEVKFTKNGSGYVVIYTPENVDITDFAVSDVQLYSIALQPATKLRNLSLTGTGLYNINLEDQRCLQSLTLTGNNFYSLSLKGRNENFVKTVLETLDISNNNITELSYDGFEACKTVNFAGNNLTAFPFSTLLQATQVNGADNKLTELNLSKCDALSHLNVSGNNISEIYLPEEGKISFLDIRGNAMTLATLPAPAELYLSSADDYLYTGQQPIQVPTKGPGIDLSEQYRVVGDAATAYTLFLEADNSEVAATKYSCTDGVIRFLDTEMGNVFVAMTHPAFPEFSIADGTALKSTVTTPAPLPTNVFAEFTTPQGGCKVSASLAATEPGTLIYVDWKGDGVELEGYEIETTYRLFAAETKAGARVKFYSYGQGAPLSVFSISGANLTNPDLSKLTSLHTLTLADADLSGGFILPEGNELVELALTNCALSSLDLSKHTNVTSLALSGNNFSGTFDLTPYADLQLFTIANNNITDVKLNNSKLWFADFTGNSIADIDLGGAPKLQQLGLAHNELQTLNLDALTDLKIIDISGNKFTFSTLPPAKTGYVLYTYANQARITPVVDLAKHTADLAASGATTYRWFIDESYYDTDQQEWMGEELYVDDEYTVADGITTFDGNFLHLVCVMTNSDFPGLTLLSNMVDVSGVESVAANDDIIITTRAGAICITTGTATRAAVFTAAGAMARVADLTAGTSTIDGLAPGIYIVTAGGKTAKIALR